MTLLVPGRCCKSALSLAKHARCLQTTNARGIYYNPAYFQQLGKERLAYRNLGQQLRRAADKFGQRTALVACAESRELSFEALRTEAATLGHHLLALGLERGDHVGLWAPNTTQFYVSCLAAALVGMPLVPLDPTLQPQELQSALRRADVKALIGSDVCGKFDFVPTLEEVLPELRADQPLKPNARLPQLRLLLLKSQRCWQAAHNYDDLLTRQAPHSHQVAYLCVKTGQTPAESPCRLQFTAGSTGRPKVALLSHLSCVNQAHIFGRSLQLQAANRRICCPVPLGHAFGMSALLAALDYGATLVLPSESFDAAATLEAIERHNCNIVLGTPSMFVEMLQEQREASRCLDSLELGVVGGAVCAPSLLLRVRRELGLRSLKVAYGLTETSGAVFVQDAEEQPAGGVRMVGGLCEHVEAKVVDEHGATVNFGERGELCVRGFFTAQGYFGEERRTVLDGGWLRTGDDFVLHDDGAGSVLGRKQDAIVRVGATVFPQEVEDALLQHRDILEAQVIGVPDGRSGEELCAFLRLRTGAADLTTEDVQLFCKGLLAQAHIPRFVRLLDALPQTAAGTVQRSRLREMFAAEGENEATVRVKSCSK